MDYSLAMTYVATMTGKGLAFAKKTWLLVIFQILIWLYSHVKNEICVVWLLAIFKPMHLCVVFAASFTSYILMGHEYQIICIESG